MPTGSERGRTLRCLVLGCGSIGRRHLQNLLALGAEEVYAFDVQAGRRQAVGAELGVRVESELEPALDRRPDVVVIAAPTDQHIPLALAAAARGCHLFIEKPLSHNLEGVAELAAQAEEQGLVTMVACNMRFHPGPATVKRLIAEGAIGQVIAGRIQTGSFLPRWRPTQDYRQSYSASPESGGAILDCIHEIDLALWYFGPARVRHALHVPASTIGLDTDGLAEILLEHEERLVSSIHLNFIQRDYRRCCQIIGKEGTIYWDFADRRVSVFGGDGQAARTCPEPEGWQLNQMYLDEMAHFLDAVRHGSTTVNPLCGGLAALRVALTARTWGET